MTARPARTDILVRPLTADDAVPLYQSVRDSLDSLSYWFPWCHAGYSRSDAADWIAHCLQSWDRRTGFPLGIFNDQGHLLGCTGLRRVDRDVDVGNLGYWVGTPHRGKDVASTAALLAARMGFEQLGFHRIEIAVLAHNLASQRVAEKLGAMRAAGTCDRLVFRGKPASTIVYSLVPGDIG